MKKYLFMFIWFLLLFNSSYAQNQPQIEIIKPKIGYTPDLSLKAQKEWTEAVKISQRLANGEKEAKLSKEEKRILKRYDDTKEDIWDIRGEGDDWYNLGGPYKVVATSELKSQDQNTYFAKNAHDSSFKTVWSEGKADYGIGEALIYYFKPKTPRVNQVIIFNGYLKTKELWQNNSRVKKLKMYVNNKLLGILELQDTMAQQTFEIKPLASNVAKQDLILRFEIAEVYPGLKYKDTVITELYFSGLDVL